MGGPDASLSSPMAVVAKVTLGVGRCLLDLVFTHVRDCEICFQCDGFLGGFWHVLPVPSCIAVCLFQGGVLAWDGPKTERGICWVERTRRMVRPSLPPF